jgi:hypothetical protein
MGNFIVFASAKKKTDDSVLSSEAIEIIVDVLQLSSAINCTTTEKNAKVNKLYNVMKDKYNGRKDIDILPEITPIGFSVWHAGHPIIEAFEIEMK